MVCGVVASLVVGSAAPAKATMYMFVTSRRAGIMLVS
jgi:hypothetical protein